MKRTLSYIGVGFLYLSAAIFLNTTNATMQIGGESIDTSSIEGHISRLHSLYVGEGAAFAGLVTKNRALYITNGIVLGNGEVKSQMGTVAGGHDNKIESGMYAGIAGGHNNKITSGGSNINQGDNSVIGGGINNIIQGNNSVIAGGRDNKIESSSLESSSVILGGKDNKAKNGGIVFGGSENEANGINNLVMGEKASGGNGSFVWNDGSKNVAVENYSGYIGAENGILIGTYDPKPGVNLVVNGAIKIGGDNSSEGVAGEIRVVDGCFYAHDGEYRHIINQGDSRTCNALPISKTCPFGNIELQAGDEAFAYSSRTSTDCSSVVAQVVCTSEGKLVNKYDSSDETHKYAYCYTISSD